MNEPRTTKSVNHIAFPSINFKLLVFLLLNLNLFSSSLMYAQESYCAFDGLQSNKSFEEKKKTSELNQHLQAYLSASASKQAQTANTIKIIPIVFHIMHQNGPENIPDSLVLRLVHQLNLRYQNAAPYFDSTGIATQIQFCLASVDPLGNPTTGITRDTTALTNVNWTGPYANEMAMKNINRWNPNLYLNVWIVRLILPGASGFSSYPSDAGEGNDGVVVQYQSATIGQPHLLSHEIGHYLGLYHTFEGTAACINNNCLIDGDRVCDTPPDVSIFGVCDSNSCSTEMNDTSGFNPFSQDVHDLPNYMDYTFCPLSFTPGQSARMHATLTSVRSSLLVSNGCGSHPGGPIPVPSFTHEMSCLGEKFINTSLNSLCAEWDFENDGVYDMIGDTVYRMYPASGNYTIKMRTTGFGGGDSITQSAYIQVRPSSIYPILYHTGYSYSPYSNRYYACVGTPITIYSFPNMASYLWSNGATTQNITFVADSSFDLSLTVVDQNGYTWTSCPAPIHVDVAPALNKPTIYSEPDSVCIADSLHLHALLNANQFVYSWNSNGQTTYNQTVLHTTASAWNNFAYVTIRDANGCKIDSDTLFLPADSMLVQPYVLGQSGNVLFANALTHNQFYKDGTPILNATASAYSVSQPGCYSVLSWYNHRNCAVMSDTVCFLSTALEAFAQSETIRLFPNPARDAITIKASAPEPLFFTLENTLGMRVSFYELSAQSEVHTLALDKVATGFYLYKITSKAGVLQTGKLFIKN